MPVELQIIRAGEFLRLDPHEHLNFEASKQALQMLVYACRKRGINRALMDLRGLPVPPQPRFTPTQLANLVQTFRDAGFDNPPRLAVLYRADPHGGARAFAFISRIQGSEVKAFEDFEAALEWLSEPDESQIENAGEAVPVQITKRRIAVKQSSGSEAAERDDTPQPIRRSMRSSALRRSRS